MGKRHGRLHLDTLFVGGGTPTCLSPPLLTSLLGHCHELFRITSATEVSVEANPGTVDRDSFRRLREAGVNRLSIGVQSFDDGELRQLGRIHNMAEAKMAIQAAKQSGFTNINIDLMYGFPGQTPSSWRRSLQTALDLKPQHLSLYQLSVEPGTQLHGRVAANASQLPEEDAVLAMDAITEELTVKAGFVQYEISNYALAGHQCRHNLNYWYNKEYFAGGALAVSYLDGVRAKRAADPEEYIRMIEHGGDAVVESEQLSREESFRETVVMGLRLVQGVSRETLLSRFDLDLWVYYREIIARFQGFDLVEVAGDRLLLSRKGRSLGNMVMAEFV